MPIFYVPLSARGSRIFLIVPFLIAAGIAGATAAAPPPYLKLAQLLGTPKLAYAAQPGDKSRLLLEFVRPGDSTTHWSKMTTVSIAVVSKPETQTATYGIIDRFRRNLLHRRIRIETFDLTPVKPYSVFFAFTAAGERDQGIAYSPASGFVTIAQVAERRHGAISNNDVKVLKSMIGRATR